MNTEEFWDKVYAGNPTRTPDENDPVLSAALNHFGNVSGAKLLDLGCGDGRSSLFFAKQGANVVSVDISEIAIANLSQFCNDNQIDNITPIKRSAFDIAIDQFDFVFGNMILHHLEPFQVFSDILRKSIVPGGKAFFHENNASSNLLIWFRKNLIGKYGIPKYGDDKEFPLMPLEVAILQKEFTVNIIYPELVFFRLASGYLFRGKLDRLTTKLDNYFFQFHNFRKHSYRQYLLLS